MHQHLQRAQLLINQGRFEQAQQELAQVLAESPHNSVAHLLMAVCLKGQDKLQEATREIETAIHLEPDNPRAHMFLGAIYLERNHFDKAESSMMESLRLDPYDEQIYGNLAQLNFAQKKWAQTIEHAKKGLEIDPDDALCENMLTLALERSGQSDIALQHSRESLQKNPDDSYSHATHAWALLRNGKHKEAQESFRESLRLDPNNEFAKQGMIQALNSNNFLFRIMFAWYSFMGRFSGRAQWGIILGLYFGQRILRMVADQNPAIRPFVMPITILYLLFALMTWVVNPIFNTFLRFNAYGKFLLGKNEIMASNFIVGNFAFGVLAAIVSLVFGLSSAAILFIGLSIFMLIPISGTFNCPRGWPFNTMAAVATLLGCVGLTAIGLSIMELEIAMAFTAVFILGMIGSQFLANYLASVTVRN